MDVHDEAALRIVDLVMDANDPVAQARFWAAALRWDVRESGGEIGLTPTDATGFGILFEPVVERWTAPGRYHLDLTTTSDEDQRETVAQLLDLGARHLDIGQGPDERNVVLADPEGNELCIIEPENGFLADCGRLGALNGDGTQAVGYFSSEVLGWPLIWDQDEETAIRSPDGSSPILAWGGPPVAPKHGKNRFHLDLAPSTGMGQGAAVERLLDLGATRLDVGQRDVDWVVLADPDGNELCVLAR